MKVLGVVKQCHGLQTQRATRWQKYKRNGAVFQKIRHGHSDTVNKVQDTSTADPSLNLTSNKENTHRIVRLRKTFRNFSLRFDTESAITNSFHIVYYLNKATDWFQLVELVRF